MATDVSRAAGKTEISDPCWQLEREKRASLDEPTASQPRDGVSTSFQRESRDSRLSSYLGCDVIVNHGLVSYHKRSDMSLSIVDLTVMGSIPCNIRQARATNDDQKRRLSSCERTVHGSY
ncbi:hypothetical protein TIFTF001_024689 [Ficus carica]|uniref:Uncharacterized protein n=1 Tax=Ficus carica TaxID=3494 RepID=A0AA88AY87_FICCA|nr:hypothetical protein TIFTF001_024689 [Ficus carica]